MKKEVTYFILLVFLISCNINRDPNFGDNYKKERDTMGYMYFYEINGKFIIWGHISQYGADDNYIILQQKPSDSIF